VVRISRLGFFGRSLPSSQAKGPRNDTTPQKKLDISRITSPGWTPRIDRPQRERVEHELGVKAWNARQLRHFLREVSPWN